MVFPTSGGGGTEGEGLEFDIIVNAREAIDDLAKWREEIERVKEEMLKLEKASGESLSGVRRALQKQQKESDLDPAQVSINNQNILRAEQEVTRQRADDARKLVEEKKRLLKEEADAEKAAAEQSKRTARETVQAKLKEIQQQVLFRKELENTKKPLIDIGSIARLVFGGTIGVIAYRALLNIVNLLKQAVVDAYEFAKSVFQLEIGVRALQRAGMDITLKEVYENIKKLRTEFGIFSNKELVAGTAALANLTRDLGFTSEEFFNMQEAVATLAIVNGRAMDEVQRTVALALSSGYTEGLQRLGVSINRVTIAQEAANMGFKGGYNALTEVQRAQATYNLILRKTALYADDLLEYQQSAPGQIDRAKNAWKDLRVEIGDNLLPVWGILAGIFADVSLFLTETNYKLGESIESWNKWGIALSFIINPLKTVVFLVRLFTDGYNDLYQAIAKGMDFNFENIFESLKDSAKDIYRELFGGEFFGDTEQTEAMKAEKMMEQINTAISNGGDDLTDIIQDNADRRRDLAEDLQRDLEKIERDGMRRREELEREYARRIADINRGAVRDIAEANRKYAYDLAKLKEDENKKVQDVIDKYRKKELEDEENFQAKMKKLREEFIFDLEEAVRARDAVAIRRLQRRFNLDRSQLIDAYELEKKQRERNFREELEDAKRQNIEKRKELWIAFQQKLADIELQRQYELQDAAIKHQQDLEDLQRRMAEQRDERMRAYRQDLEDLNKAMTERLKTLAKALAQEVEYTAQAAKAVYDALKAYYGPGGYIEQLYKYYLEYASQMPQLPGGGTGGNSINTPNFAYGGSMIATTPTTFRAGDLVPEAVTITPLINRNTSFSNAKAMGGVSASGMMRVLVSLSPGLEGKIIEDTLSQFDNILAGVERSR